MADPIGAAGLGLAAVSLTIQIFDGCIKGYHIMEGAINMPEDCAAMKLRLRIEFCRLLDWGEVAGLLKVKEEVAAQATARPAKTAEEIAEEQEALEHEIRREIRVNRVVIVAVLTEIKTLLRKFAKANGRYEELQSKENEKEINQKDAISDIDLAKFKEIFESPELAQEARKYRRGFNHIVETYKGVGSVLKHPKRLKWVTIDREEFKNLLARLKELTDYLHQTMGDRQMEILQETSRQTYLALLQVSNSVKSINSLLTAKTEMNRHPISGADADHEQLLESLTRFKLSTAELGTDDSQNGGNPLDVTEAALASSLDKQAARVIAKYKGSTVWIEWRACKSKLLKPWVGPDDPLFEKTEPDPDSVEKVKEVVKLLTLDKPAEFCIPHCLGYMVKPSHRQFGLIFEAPDKSITQNPVSLQSLLGKSTPPISQRIALAKKLVTCVLYLHSVNWLHKYLCSENVLFFSTTNDNKNDLSHPYLSGFDFARPDRPDQTNSGGGQTQIPHWTFHTHPEYVGRTNQGLYVKTYDIYSLGILLLEIAYWKSVHEIPGIPAENEIVSAEKAQRQAEEVKAELSREGSPVVGGVRDDMGERYADAVRACVRGREAFGISGKANERDGVVGALLQQVFIRMVVDVLKGITV